MRDHKKNKLRLYFLSSPSILNIDYLLKIVKDYSCTVSGVSVESQDTAKYLTFGIIMYTYCKTENEPSVDYNKQ